MKILTRVGIFLTVALLIGAIAYIVNVFKMNRIKDEFENPKIGQVYILSNGNAYFGYQIKRIEKDSIYFNKGKSYYNGFKYDNMKTEKNFFSSVEVGMSNAQLKGYLDAEYGQLGLFDITEIEE